MMTPVNAYRPLPPPSPPPGFSPAGLGPFPGFAPLVAPIFAPPTISAPANDQFARVGADAFRLPPMPFPADDNAWMGTDAFRRPTAAFLPPVAGMPGPWQPVASAPVLPPVGPPSPWSLALPPQPLANPFAPSWPMPVPAPQGQLPLPPFMMPLRPAESVQQPPPARPVWINDLKRLIHENKAVIYALNIRTFAATDRDRDGRILPRLGENGTFLSAIRRLDELKSLGVNTIHLLPINPIGRSKRFGDAGSLYAPSDFHRLNPEFDVPNNGLGVEDEARMFIDECHKRGIRVMVDVPSCGSYDFVESKPDLVGKDANGKLLTPTDWVDIVMLKNDQHLRDYFEGFFNLMNRIGVDGYRVDVARARPIWFWEYFIGKNADKAWLAETYTEEDQSPLQNIPRDTPEAFMKAGFDTMYGQWHIFDLWPNAKTFNDYLLQNRAMFLRASKTGGNDKSFIGSYLTHDDLDTLMQKGGVPLCLLASGLMTTQPWTNPYILDGFTTGYPERIDIFNYVPQHQGSHPEIGLFLKHMLNLRRQTEPVLNKGLYIPVPVSGNKQDQIIAYARHANGRTLLIVANKDVNGRQVGMLKIPGLAATQPMTNLAPEYGRPSRFVPGNGQLAVNLGPGRFHIFEINTPNLPQQLPAY